MLWPAAGQKIVHLGGGGPVQVAEACEDIFGVDFFLFPVSGDYLDLCLRFYMIFLKTRSFRIMQLLEVGRIGYRNLLAH